jgi:RNA polymerase sigma-70 factor (ECF subfamily)
MTPEEDSPRFLTTRWTMVLPGHGEDSRAQAWDHVCRTYWYPVYAFIRRRGTPPEDASDLTQGFFAKLIG